MDGKRIQEYWSQEIQALIGAYKYFETLIPSKGKSVGSSHHPEDGRFVESLIKEVLQKYLPKELEVVSGFILRPAVKVDNKQNERKNESDDHSTQLDLIVYDSANYPTYLRFGDTCVVPPEGVVAIISIKKHLRSSNIEPECVALQKASLLCRSKEKRRGPFLALIGISSDTKKAKNIGKKLQQTYGNSDNKPYFTDIIGYIGALEQWSIFKDRPPSNYKEARFISFEHTQDNDEHLGLQFLLTGILSVYYDKSRKNTQRPGFTSFPSKEAKEVFEIECAGER